MHTVPRRSHHSPRSYIRKVSYYTTALVCITKLLAVVVSLKKYAGRPLQFISDWNMISRGKVYTVVVGI